MRVNRKGIVNLLLPAAIWWIIAGAVNVGIIVYDMARELSCGDCAYRGRGAGGEF